MATKGSANAGGKPVQEGAKGTKKPAAPKAPKSGGKK